MATPQISEFEDEVSDTISNVSNLMEDPVSIANERDNYSSLSSTYFWNIWEPSIFQTGFVSFDEPLMPPEVIRPEVRNSLIQYESRDAESNTSAANWMGDSSIIASGREGLESSVVVNETYERVMIRPGVRNSLSRYESRNAVSAANRMEYSGYIASGGDLENSMSANEANSLSLIMTRPEETDSPSYFESRYIQSSVNAANWMEDPSYTASGGEEMESSMTGNEISEQLFQMFRIVIRPEVRNSLIQYESRDAESNTSAANWMGDSSIIASGREGLESSVVVNETYERVMIRPGVRNSLSRYESRNAVSAANRMEYSGYIASGGDLENSMSANEANSLSLIMTRPEETDSPSYFESRYIQSSVNAANWMEDPSYTASGGEEMESSMTGNEISEQLFQMFRIKLKNIDKMKALIQKKSSFVCQERDDEADITIHGQTEIPETVVEDHNIALERRFCRLRTSQVGSTDFRTTFTYPDFDRQDTLQTSTMTAPSTAYYNSNYCDPIFFPTPRNANPVSENIYTSSSQYFNNDDVHSFGEVSEEFVDQSNEAYSDNDKNES